jgi:hypothetical protein
VYLQVDPYRTGPAAYYAYDSTDPRFFIESSLRTVGTERVLSFIVVARLPDGSRGKFRGREFFTAMMDHFGDPVVDVIEGQWELTNPDWSTNLVAFNLVTGASNVTETVAATQVPTGVFATRRGYTKVTVVRADPAGARGQYTHVVAHFRK